VTGAYETGARVSVGATVTGAIDRGAWDSVGATVTGANVFGTRGCVGEIEVGVLEAGASECDGAKVTGAHDSVGGVVGSLVGDMVEMTDCGQPAELSVGVTQDGQRLLVLVSMSLQPQSVPLHPLLQPTP
jgi:hypothetical protein